MRITDIHSVNVEAFPSEEKASNDCSRPKEKPKNRSLGIPLSETNEHRKLCIERNREFSLGISSPIPFFQNCLLATPARTPAGHAPVAAAVARHDAAAEAAGWRAA